MYRYFFFSLALYFSLVLPVHAYDVTNTKFPMFVGVKRVFIHFEYMTPNMESDEIPMPLHKDVIQKRLIDLYTKRFSSTECAEYFKTYRGTMKPYECHDQPVKLAINSGLLTGKKTRFTDGTTATAEEINDPGTLLVVFSVIIAGNHRHYNPPLEVPHFSATHFQYRRKLDIPVIYMKGPYHSAPINQSDEFIEEYVLRSMFSKIN